MPGNGPKAMPEHRRGAVTPQGRPSNSLKRHRTFLDGLYGTGEDITRRSSREKIPDK